MKLGASVSTAQLLKTVTRGKTTRLSVDSMLEFFRPLELWLQQQNRNEIVIGWNSNLDDVALFQSMQSGSCAAKTTIGVILAGFVLHFIYFLVKYQ